MICLNSPIKVLEQNLKLGRAHEIENSRSGALRCKNIDFFLHQIDRGAIEAGSSCFLLGKLGIGIPQVVAS